MKMLKRKTAIARLRREAKRNGDTAHLSRSIADFNRWGEACIVGKDGKVFISGTLEEVLRGYHLLRDDETIDKK